MHRLMCSALSVAVFTSLGTSEEKNVDDNKGRLRVATATTAAWQEGDTNWCQRHNG